MRQNTMYAWMWLIASFVGSAILTFDISEYAWYLKPFVFILAFGDHPQWIATFAWVQAIIMGIFPSFLIVLGVNAIFVRRILEQGDTITLQRLPILLIVSFFMFSAVTLSFIGIIELIKYLHSISKVWYFNHFPDTYSGGGMAMMEFESYFFGILIFIVGILAMLFAKKLRSIEGL